MKIGQAIKEGEEDLILVLFSNLESILDNYQMLPFSNWKRVCFKVLS